MLTTGKSRTGHKSHPQKPVQFRNDQLHSDYQPLQLTQTVQGPYETIRLTDKECSSGKNQTTGYCSNPENTQTVPHDGKVMDGIGRSSSPSHPQESTQCLNDQWCSAYQPLQAIGKEVQGPYETIRQNDKEKNRCSNRGNKLTAPQEFTIETWI